MKKRVLTILLGLAMIVSLAGCGSKKESSTSETTATDKYPAEKVMIGVELYDPTESETLAMQDYFNKIAETYNVEFKYSEAIADADAEMKFIEDCATAGCKGFFAYYNVTGAQQIQSVIDYSMYYYGSIGQEGFDEFNGDPYFLGYVGAGGNEYDAGKALAEWVTEKGYKNVVYANGGADFGVAQFVDRQNGFKENIGSDVNVTTVSGFPGDQFFADQAAALSTPGLEAVVASFNGVDFWAQPIASAGLTEKVELATIGSVNKTYLDAFTSKSCSLLVSNNIQAYGLMIPIICNAVDGNSEALMDDGNALNLRTEFWKVSNAEDCQKLYDVMTGDGVFSTEQLMELSVKNNKDATIDTLKDLIKTSSMESILSR